MTEETSKNSGEKERSLCVALASAFSWTCCLQALSISCDFVLPAFLTLLEAAARVLRAVSLKTVLFHRFNLRSFTARGLGTMTQVISLINEFPPFSRNLFEWLAVARNLGSRTGF